MYHFLHQILFHKRTTECRQSRNKQHQMLGWYVCDFYWTQSLFLTSREDNVSIAGVETEQCHRSALEATVGNPVRPPS